MRRLPLLLAALGATVVAASAQDEPALVVKTRARLKELQKDLEGMREGRFEGPVAIKAQTAEGCRKAFEVGLRGWLPDWRSKPLSRAYGKVGLLPRGYELLPGLEELYATEVFAYYQPGEGTFYVVDTPLPEGSSIDALMLHELSHALQDQRFKLSSIYALAAGKENDDLALALQFLIEGEAYYVTIAAQARERDDAAHLDELAEAEGAFDRDGLEAEYQRRLAAVPEGARKIYEESAARRAKLPLYVWRRYMEPYTKGCFMISKVKRAGGWKAIDALWKQPPTSTEQVLHPEKLLAAERDEPVSVRLEDLSEDLGQGWKRTTTNVLGELGMQVVLANRFVENIAAVSSGWGGDRLDAYEKDEQTTATVWFTTWDDERAAETFERALPLRTGGAALRGGKDVVVVEGAPDAKKVAARALERVRKTR